MSLHSHKLATFPFRRVLPISPDLCAQGWDLLPSARALAAAGLPGLLLREPSLEAGALRALLTQLRPLFPELVLHSRNALAWELATEFQTGLHLPGGADLRAACQRAARARTSARLGLSAHQAHELHEAQDAGLDYALLSPAFSPTSKPEDQRVPLGVEGLVQASAGLSVPVFALGGITPIRAQLLRQAGIPGVAVLGGLFDRKLLPEAVYDQALRLLRAMQDPHPTPLEPP